MVRSATMAKIVRTNPGIKAARDFSREIAGECVCSKESGPTWIMCRKSHFPEATSIESPRTKQQVDELQSKMAEGKYHQSELDDRGHPE